MGHIEGFLGREAAAFQDEAIGRGRRDIEAAMRPQMVDVLPVPGGLTGISVSEKGRKRVKTDP